MDLNWPLVSVEDIKAPTKYSIAIGPFGSRMKSDCYVSDGVPVIRGNNLSSSKLLVGDFVYISSEKADELASSNVFAGDLVFPHRGNIGEVGIVPADKPRYILSSSLMKLTVNQKKVNPLFLFYFFRSIKGRHELLKNASQVGTPGIATPLTSLKSIQIKLPPLSIQCAIANILGTLDDKIELNNKINQTLESISQAIFKSWFVDFEPVKAKIAAIEAGEDVEAITRAAMSAISGKTDKELDQLQAEYLENYTQLKTTAELFPAAMQDLELGEIPEGWVVRTLGSLVIELRRGISPKYTDEDGILVINQRCIRDHLVNFSLARRNNTKLQKVEGREIQVGDVLVNSTGVGTLGRLANIRYLPEPAVVDSHITVVRASDEISPLFLNEYMLTKESFIEASGAGSTGQTELRKQVLEELFVVVPNRALTDNLIDHFETIIKPISSLIAKGVQECQSLTQLRDTLLPKLLSGELEINAVNKAES